MTPPNKKREARTGKPPPPNNILVADTVGASIFKSPLRLIVDPLLDQGVAVSVICRKLKKEYPYEAPTAATIRGYRKNYYLVAKGITAEGIHKSAPPPLPDLHAFHSDKLPTVSGASNGALAPEVVDVDTIEGDIADLYVRINRLKMSCFVTREENGAMVKKEVVDLDTEKAINDYIKTINSLRELRQKYHLDNVAEAVRAQTASQVAQIALRVFVPSLTASERRPLVDQFKAQLGNVMSTGKVDGEE